VNELPDVKGALTGIRVLDLSRPNLHATRCVSGAPSETLTMAPEVSDIHHSTTE
jgi:hypothetical protein